jgi:hypothetical protein
MNIPLCNNRFDVTNRRDFLTKTSLGIGGVAAAALMQELQAAESPLKERKAPLPHKAKAVIHIFAGGAPSHLDTFDYKPEMKKFDGTSSDGGQREIFYTPFNFTPSGKSGIHISDAFPQLQTVADEMCLINSMSTDVPAHGPAAKLIHTGSLVLPKPSLGSWVLYGLGTENQSLPGFITMGGAADWRQSSFLPSLFQGSNANFNRTAAPNKVLPNLFSEFTTSDSQKNQIDLSKKLNIMHEQRVQKDEQLEARIESFELAFRMQAAATDAFDIKKESDSTREMYGNTELGAKLLVARRLVERGVRFVQIEAGGWDHHTDVKTNVTRVGGAIDTPAAALIRDLKQRGLLDSTLIIWGGEFGRTVTTPGRVNERSGRDHHSKAFSMWMAGGGVKGGTRYGKSDEIGKNVAEDPVTAHDLHATILRLLGFDHTQLTYRYNGRDFRLTDNFGEIIKEIIA